MPVKPIPDGYHAVTPYLVIQGAARALDFYKEAFGATETMRMPGPDGRVMHAEIRIGESVLMAGDERAGSKATPAGVSVVYVVVPDADAAYERARAAGAEVTEPVDQSYGSRDVTVTDPDGNRWSLGTYGGAG